MLMKYYSSEHLPYEIIASDIADIFTAQKVVQHSDYVLTDLHNSADDTKAAVLRVEAMLRRDDPYSAGLELLKNYRGYARGALSRVTTDPLGASRDFVAQTLYDKGVKRYTVDMDEGSYTVEYLSPTFNISAQGEAARKLKHLYDDVVAGRQFKYTFDSSEDYEITHREYGPEAKVETSKPEKFEIWSRPHEFKRRVILNSGASTVTLDAILAYNELEGYLTLAPERRNDHLDFSIRAPTPGGVANLKIEMKVGTAAPDRTFLQLYRFFAGLRPESEIAFIDEDTELEFWKTNFQEVDDVTTADEISYVAAYLRDFLEVDYWLRFKKIAPQGLTWPITQSSSDDVGALLGAMATALKHGEVVKPVNYSFSAIDVDRSAYDIEVKDSVLSDANFFAKIPIVLNNTHVCNSISTLPEPRIKLSRDGVEIECHRLSDVFPASDVPVDVETWHDKSVWTLEKS
jgi:hypothetical protein